MYRIRIKKAPIQKAQGGGELQMGDQAGYGLYVAEGARRQPAAGNRKLAPGNGGMGGFLPPLQRAQTGGVVDYFKQKMLDNYGKYLVTDKGTNRTFYGYRGPDGKMIENNFEVLTGKTGDMDYYSPYSLGETERRPKAFQENIRVTPVGSFPLSVNTDIYGSPGLNIENSNGLAMHTTYDPAVRGAYYNNNNPLDNYASYGCINCRKPDIANVMKGFGAKDYINIVDSRKSVEDNLALARDNKYLYNHPEAARMLFENPNARFVRRQWNGDKGLYEGADSDYNPYTETIVEKKELAPVTVVGRRNKSKNTEAVAQSLPGRGNPSVVDFLNSIGVDSSKANRKNLAHDLGLKDYNYTAADNMNLLRLLQQQESLMQQGGGFYSRESGGFYQAGGAVEQTLQPVGRHRANIEAERGETIMGDFDQDGQQEHMAVGGRRHAQGGTPLQVPDGSFVFSDTRKLKIGGPVLQEFGKSATTKKKYTPAELAKQYDLNRYKEILDDPDADFYSKRTAEAGLEFSKRKLAKLALYQEGLKGFPQGIPDIALPALPPEMVQALQQQSSGGSQLGAPGGGPSPEARDDSLPAGLPVAQVGGQSSFHPPMQLPKMSPIDQLNSLIFPGLGVNGFSASNSGKLPVAIPSWFKVWTKSNTPAGSISPTGKSTVYDPSQGNSLYDDYRYWSSVAGRPFTDAKDYQSFVYNQVRKGGTDALFKMWGDYGLTKAGSANPDDPDWGFADGYFGARTAALSHWRPKPDVPAVPEDKPETRTEPLKPADYPKPGTPSFQMGSPDRMPWWQQDKINLGAAYRNRYGLNKYMPTYVGSDVVLPNSVYYDPTRSVAATQGSAALQHMMNMAYGRPQLARSIQSNVSGQEYGQVGNTLADFANRNVAVGNQSATIRAGLLNEQNRFNRGSLDMYLKGNTIANQQYDNAVRILNNDVRRNLLSGITNAQKTYWMNRLNPYYSINPGSGQLFFKQGKALDGPAMGSMAGSDPLSLYNSYVQQYMDKVQGADRKSAQEFALRAAFANKSKYGVDSDGDSQMSMSGLGYNPAMMAYLQGSMPQFPLSP